MNNVARKISPSRYSWSHPKCRGHARSELHLYFCVIYPEGTRGNPDGSNDTFLLLYFWTDTSPDKNSLNASYWIRADGVRNRARSTRADLAGAKSRPRWPRECVRPVRAPRRLRPVRLRGASVDGEDADCLCSGDARPATSRRGRQHAGVLLPTV